MRRHRRGPDDRGPIASGSRQGDAGEAVILSEKLSEIPGKRLTIVRVNYPPGGKSGRHRHAGNVSAYILSGAVRSQNSATGPSRVYRAGEAFFEPSGSTHLVSENASATEPASFIAVFVADDGAVVTRGTAALPDRLLSGRRASDHVPDGSDAAP